MSTTEHQNPLWPIFAIRQKSELVDYCAGLEVSSHDLLDVVLRARSGEFGNYHYACHIVDAVPDTIPLAKEDLHVLAHTGQVLQARDVQFFRRVFLDYDSSKVFAAHLFYTADCQFWYAFCFDKHDKGSRISLVTDHFRLPLEDVWGKITVGQMDFPKLSIMFRQ